MIGGLIAAAAVLAAFAGPWGARMLDLDVYRIGGDALRSGTDLYAVHETSANLVFTYPVFAALLFVPFAVLPLGVARVLLTLVSLAALFVIMHLTVGYVRRGLGPSSSAGPSRSADPSGSADPPRGPRHAASVRSDLAWSVPLSVLAVVAHPVWETLNFGQVNLILTALVLVDVLGTRGRSRGVLVGIATGIKLVPGLFILYFVVTGQRRAALTSAITTLGTVAIGFAVQPEQAWAFWTRHALNPDRTGGIAYVTNQSFLGISARLLREPHPPRAVSLALGAVAVVVALLVARKLYRYGDSEDAGGARLTAVCVVGVASLLASPVSWSHHWVWAIPCLGTLVIWARRAPAAGQRWRWVVFGVVTAIVVTAPMQFTPKEELRELHHTLPQQFVANIYGLLAVLYLGWVAVRVLRPPSTAVTASTSDASLRHG